MGGIGRLLFQLFRALCYATLAFVVVGFAIVFILPSTGACPNIIDGKFSCTSSLATILANIGMLAVVGTVYTGLPAIFAFLGGCFLLLDFFNWRNRRAGVSAAPNPELDISVRSPSPAPAPAIGRFLLIGVGILFAIAIVGGIIAGTMESGGQ